MNNRHIIHTCFCNAHVRLLHLYTKFIYSLVAAVFPTLTLHEHDHNRTATQQTEHTKKLVHQQSRSKSLGMYCIYLDIESTHALISKLDSFVGSKNTDLLIMSNLFICWSKHL